MSRILESLIGNVCTIETEDTIEEHCTVCDVDDNWIKITVPGRKDKVTTKIFSTDIIENIEIED